MNKIKRFTVRWFLLILIFSLSACNTSPHKMISQGDMNGLTAKFNEGLSVNALSEDKRESLLAAAATKGNASLVSNLLRRGADVNLADKTNYTPLYRASWKGHKAVVKLLLDAGADVHIASKYGSAPLYIASASDRLPVVKLLLAYGANMSKKNNKGLTPLLVAAKNGRVEVFSYLLEHGADLMGVGRDDWNVAHYAANNGEGGTLLKITELVSTKYLYTNSDVAQEKRRQANQLLNGRTKADAWTPLHTAANKGKSNTTRILLEAGANPTLTARVEWDNRNQTGWTPLHLAAIGNHKRVMKLLVEAGANPNAKTSSGESATYLRNEKVRNVQRANSSDSDFDMGKLFAIAGGAALASSSNLSSVQKADFMTNYTKDVLGDTGGTNTRNWGNNGGSSSSDINDPLNPNNPINKRMSAQVKRNVSLHEQKQQQAKQAYAAQLKQRTQEINQQRAASLRSSGFTSNSQPQAVSQQSGSSVATKSKYSGMSFAAKDDESQAKEPEKEKVETPPVAVSKGQMFGDSEEYYYSKESSMNIAQTHLQNNTAEFCGSSLKSKLSWHDGSTTCEVKNEQFRCKVYAAATCFDKSCDTFFCGTKR